MFQEHLGPALSRLGAYSTRLELLRALVQESDSWPTTSGLNAPWLLNALGHSYSMIGQTRKAVNILRRVVKRENETGSPNNQATALQNLSDDLLKLGELREAEEQLLSSIILSDTTSAQGEWAAGKRELGRVAIFKGQFAFAQTYLNVAIDRFKTLGQERGRGVAWAY